MFEYISFEHVEGKHNRGDLKLFGLSTCGFCRRAVKFLDESSIAYDHILVNEIDPELKQRAKDEFLKKFDQKMNFPTLIIDDSDYQIGFIRVAWERLFPDLGEGADLSIGEGLIPVSKVSKFVDKAAAYNKWYVNPDNDFRQDIENGLLNNFKKYGYYHCPCRESKGDKNENMDIACPCRYAAADIKEWGQCYCGLFVSKKFYKNRTETGSIPERRK